MKRYKKKNKIIGVPLSISNSKYVKKLSRSIALEPLYPYNSTNPLSHIKAKLDK